MVTARAVPPLSPWKVSLQLLDRQTANRLVSLLAESAPLSGVDAYGAVKVPSKGENLNSEFDELEQAGREQKLSLLLELERRVPLDRVSYMHVTIMLAH